MLQPLASLVTQMDIQTHQATVIHAIVTILPVQRIPTMLLKVFHMIVRNVIQQQTGEMQTLITVPPDFRL